MLSEIKDTEIYAILHKEVVIFIGITKKPLNECIITHFNNVIREPNKNLEFYPKLYSYIIKNSNIKEYSFHSFGKYNRNEALSKSIEAMNRFKTFDKCNSYRRNKDPEPLDLSNNIERRRKKNKYLNCFYTCDQTGKRFDTIRECAEYYGTSASCIRGRIRSFRKNKKNKSKNKLLDGITFTRTLK